jgi:hypothetical protein
MSSDYEDFPEEAPVSNDRHGRPSFKGQLADPSFIICFVIVFVSFFGCNIGIRFTKRIEMEHCVPDLSVNSIGYPPQTVSHTPISHPTFTPSSFFLSSSKQRLKN